MTRLSAKWSFLLFTVLIAIGALCVANSAYAQGGSPPQQQQAVQGLKNASGQMDAMLYLVESSARGWYRTLKGFAVKLFWLLALIQFVWTFFPLIFRQADFADVVHELVRFILVIGFFMALLQYTDEWTAAIINSFQEVGFLVLNQTPNLDTTLLTDGKSGRITGLYPGRVFRVAVEIANRVSQVSVNAVEQAKGDMLGQMLPLAGLTIMLCFVFISAFMALTLIESWFVINASVLFMGLGGSEWTRQYARQMLTYAFSVGVKMFVMIIVVGLIMSSVAGWEEAFKQETNSVVAVWTTVGLALVAAFFSKSIPDLVQGLITGATSSSSAYAAEGTASMMANRGVMPAGHGGMSPGGEGRVPSAINSSGNNIGAEQVDVNSLLDSNRNMSNTDDSKKENGGTTPTSAKTISGGAGATPQDAKPGASTANPQEELSDLQGQDNSMSSDLSANPSGQPISMAALSAQLLGTSGDATPGDTSQPPPSTDTASTGSNSIQSTSTAEGSASSAATSTQQTGPSAHNAPSTIIDGAAAGTPPPSNSSSTGAAQRSGTRLPSTGPVPANKPSSPPAKPSVSRGDRS